MDADIVRRFYSRLSNANMVATGNCCSAPRVVKGESLCICSACVFVAGSVTIQGIGANATMNRIACAKGPNRLENEWAVREVLWLRFRTSRRACIGLHMSLPSMIASRLNEYGLVNWPVGFRDGHHVGIRSRPLQPDLWNGYERTYEREDAASVVPQKSRILWCRWVFC